MFSDLKADLERIKSAERRIEELMAQLEDQASTWEQRSEQAYALGEEDLAREALARRSGCLKARQELLTRLSQVKMTHSQLEKELHDAIKEDSKNTVLRVAEEIKALQQELKRAQASRNTLLASVLEEKIEALLSLGRKAWDVAFPEEASRQTPAWEENLDSFYKPFPDLYSKEIDLELENLKRRMDAL